MNSLTFIIPLYNGSTYISRCLKSIFSQTCTNYELIIIDDGSTDNSLTTINNVIKEYNTSNIPVILHTQPNSGVAAARNLGIQLATSEYIAFIDQDDYIESDFCQKYMIAASEHPYDMIIGGFCRKDDSGKLLRSMIPTDDSWSKYCLTYPWGRIIRRDFLINNNIRFLKTSIGEDVYFDLVAYSYTNNIKMLPDCSYVWVDNPTSVSNSQYTIINNLTNPIYTFDQIKNDLNPNNLIPPLFEEYYFLKFTIWYMLVSVRRSRYKDILTMRDTMFNWLNEHYPNYKKNPYISPFKPKGDLLFNRLSVWCYMILHKLKIDKIILYVLSK